MPAQKGRKNSFSFLPPSRLTMHSVQTAGEVFGDGTVIELIRNKQTGRRLNLVIASGNSRKSAPMVAYQGLEYRPRQIAPSVLSALRLPIECSECAPAATLFAAVRQLFLQHGSLRANIS
jgi:hypothetical protein